MRQTPRYKTCTSCEQSFNGAFTIIDGKKVRLSYTRTKCTACAPHVFAPWKESRGTKVCATCEKVFSTSPVVEGKKRKLYIRNNCFECIPFRENVSKKRKEKRDSPTRDCLGPCGRKDLPRSDFDWSDSNCKWCRSAILREKAVSLKQQSVDYLGGSCSVCGYGKISGLVFHHREPSEKSFELSKAFRRRFSWSMIRAELDKCMLLCANCHMEEHDMLERVKHDDRRKLLESPTPF